MRDVLSNYQIGRAQPGDIPEIIALADRVFRPDGRSSMGTEFPLFLAAANAENIYVARCDHVIVAMLGVFYRSLVLPHATLLVAMIGAVATDEPHRGRGLAGALLDTALADVRAAGAAIAFISGVRGLYQRRGAREAGALVTCTVSARAWKEWRRPLDIVWREYEPTDAPAVHALHAQQVPRFERTRVGMDSVIRARPCGIRTFTACRADQPVAYAVFKSMEETAVVTEFNGDLSVLSSLAVCLPRSYAGPLQFLLSRQHPLVGVLQGLAEVQTEPAAFDGTLVWGDFCSCVVSLEGYWHACGVPPLRAQETEGKLVLTDGRRELRLPPPAMCAAVWGARDAPPMPEEWQRAFPLPLCPYGLDYV